MQMSKTDPKVLRKEMEILTKCQHPNIVSYHGTCMKVSEKRYLPEACNDSIIFRRTNSGF